MKFEYAPGATPFDPDEINGLIPMHELINVKKWPVPLPLPTYS